MTSAIQRSADRNCRGTEPITRSTDDPIPTGRHGVNGDGDHHTMESANITKRLQPSTEGEAWSKFDGNLFFKHIIDYLIYRREGLGEIRNYER